MRTLKLNKVLLPAILVILSFSVLLNVFFYIQMRKYYSSVYAVELDPLGLSYFQDESPQQPNGKTVVVFFGDSRAAQWTDPTLAGFFYINRGIGNQTSSQVAGRFDEHVRPLQPKVVIVQVGINDLKTIPLFPERNLEITENCKANIQKIVQDSLDLKAIVVLTTIFPASENVPLARRLVWSNDIYDAIDNVNDYILGMAGENVIVFDTAKILSDANGKTKSEYSFDLLHLNEAGYQALNLELEKILEGIK